MKDPEAALLPREAALAAVQEALRYQFRDPALLAQALCTLWPPLTSEMARTRSRLQFLGDAAWNFAVAGAAVGVRPRAAAGELSRLRAAWSSTAGLARLARQLQLPTPDVPQTRRPGARDPGGTPPAAKRKAAKAIPPEPSDRVVAEMFEAMLGAMVEDGGLDAVRALARGSMASEGIATRPPPVDPKSALQMLAQARSGKLPTYRLLGKRGPAHRPRFRVRVTVPCPSGDVRAEAEGQSRQAAEQQAAKLALQEIDAAGAFPQAQDIVANQSGEPQG